MEIGDISEFEIYSPLNSDGRERKRETVKKN